MRHAVNFPIKITFAAKSENYFYKKTINQDKKHILYYLQITNFAMNILRISLCI